MKVSGVGKFSFLSIVDDCIFYDFEKVFVGKSVTKTFIIQNPSLVYVILLIHRLMPSLLLKDLSPKMYHVLNFRLMLELYLQINNWRSLY